MIHRLVLIALAGAVLASCAAPHARLVREAQDAFSRGATFDLETKVAAASSSANLLESADQHYAIALGFVERALNESASALARDHLWGTAMTIKSLASWRLARLRVVAASETDAARRQSQLQGALQAAAEVTAAADDSDETATRVWPRDRILCASLPALVEIDDLATKGERLHDQMPVDERDAQVTALLSRAQGAAAALDAHRSLLPGHPVTQYLAQAECELAWVLSRSVPSAYASGVPDDVAAAGNAIRTAALAALQSAADREANTSRKDRLARLLEYYRDRLVAL